MADKFQLKALITGVDKLSPVLSGVRKNAANLRKQLNSSGLGKITFMDALQGGAIAAPFVMGAQAAIKFESAMADVKKVVNFDTPEQFKAMGDDVLGLSERLPMAAEGIAQIVAAGGQSGIAREELNKFAEDAVKMGVAFDQTAAQSGEMMAKWRTAFHMNQEEVVALADKINYLGNTGAASTAQISAIVTAIGPLGEVAGVNAGQLAAMGSALAGVGISQDVAATGIKNFMLTLAAGTAATKAQKEAFKALRLDANEISKGMQTDSEGTINRVLKTLAKVEKSKQAAVLTNLFGKESVGAIAPLLTSLDTLQTNFQGVGKAGKFAGSMQAEYTARAATTQNALQLMQNRVTRLGITVGSVLLPPLNDFLALVGPLVSEVSAFAGANPVLIKGLIGAAVGFTVLRLATAGATAALTLMNAVSTMSPVGLVVRAIAITAGILIANWSLVAPFFEKVWSRIRVPAMAVWSWLKGAFQWTPIPLIQENWGPLTELFGSIWELVQALSVPFFDFMKTAFDWSPLGLVIKHWEPITAFFKGLWADLKPFIEPMMSFLGFTSDGEGVIKAASSKVKGWADAQKARNEEGQPAPGQLVKPIAPMPELLPQATQVASLLRSPANDGAGALARAPALQLVRPPSLPAETSQALEASKSLPKLPAQPPSVKAVLPGPPPSVKAVLPEQPPSVKAVLQMQPAGVKPFLPVPKPPANALLPEAESPTPSFLTVSPEAQAALLKVSAGTRPVSPLVRPEATAGSLPERRGSLVQQTAATQGTDLKGSMIVRFENAPAGMRADPAQTNQPGLTVSPQVGYRSLGRAS